MRGTTATGFEFEVSDQINNDMELLEALESMQDGDALALAKVARKILGKQKDALYDHLRTEDGRVPIEAVTQEIKDIFGAFKDGPKS
jgi:hypothetical protein